MPPTLPVDQVTAYPMVDKSSSTPFCCRSCGLLRFLSWTGLTRSNHIPLEHRMGCFQGDFQTPCWIVEDFGITLRRTSYCVRYLFNPSLGAIHFSFFFFSLILCGTTHLFPRFFFLFRRLCGTRKSADPENISRGFIFRGFYFFVRNDPNTY